MDLGNPPAGLRALGPYITIYKQFLRKNDFVTCYYALQHAVREGIKAKGDRAYLGSLLDTMEAMKKGVMKDKEELNESVGAAHVENVALKIFLYADGEDKNGSYHNHKNMIKAYFTSYHLFSIVAEIDNELSEEIKDKQKFAMWRAVEIDRCIKNGIPPTPPPDQYQPPSPPPPPAVGDDETKPTPKPRSLASQSPAIIPPPHIDVPYPPPQVDVPYPPPQIDATYPPPQIDVTHPPATASADAARPTPAFISEAQKKCRFAISALDYDDIEGALQYLTEARNMLITPK